ncbi:MAG: metallophosphoesterase [Clostridiales bacterium]|nr:metallophosphoesterase [Clostridiales bacterium]
MKLLLLADHEERVLWDDWNNSTAQKLSDVDLILSAGDLNADYLEFLVTMLNVPLVYVRGNHDGQYDKKPPEGCVDADGRIVEVACGKGAAKEKVRILGLGGSMRYKDDAGDMYTEKEMSRRIAGLHKAFFLDRLRGKTGFDIMLTHAPCKGYGDMEDIAHTGFECFNHLLDRHHPKLHVYGHVHKEYGRFESTMIHESGTQLINASGHYIVEI